jgi:hypothetical protein
MEMLTAALIDEIRALQYAYVSAHSKGKPEAPEPIARPGIASKRRRRKLTPEQAERLFRHINGIESTEG